MSDKPAPKARKKPPQDVKSAADPHKPFTAALSGHYGKRRAELSADLLRLIQPTMLYEFWDVSKPSARERWAEEEDSHCDPGRQQEALAREREAFDSRFESGPSRSTARVVWSTEAAPRRDNGWLSSAPKQLIDHYNTAAYKDVLGRLLRDPRMARTWEHIEEDRRDQIEQPRRLAFTYDGLWGAMQTAFSRANHAETRRKAGKPPLHAEKREHALKAARFAARLAAHIGKDEALDYLSHTLFPDDVEQLALMAIPDRNLNKAAVSLANTTFVELLAEFQRRAQESAQTKPIVLRVRAKKEAEKDARLLTFVRELHDVFFKHRFARPMHTAIAAIATVALDLPAHEEITDDYVRRALPGKSDNKRPE